MDVEDLFATPVMPQRWRVHGLDQHIDTTITRRYTDLADW